ncbi:type VI secretion system Vgr family protein [Acinetobacter bereziniae]|jgi:type VI secretion system secreted protein VgrG|uniref:type VI secretion system Vgr family protein n=1 Tax=Acinetobacter bereziniae TaxID=106648 RepID=UPI00125FF1FF|nr:type VI secretion system Vgr family protein [Acinetobacter bereziniae]MDM1786062.1 type VI secretion system tip protein VgrG [Acinetobacter bereziniae]
MSNNIYVALEQLGLTAQKRAIHLQFSNTALNDQVFLQRIEGTHQLNEGIQLQLICLSTNSAIPLKQFIGAQVAVDIVNDQSELNRISGIVTHADAGASDGSLCIYRLKVEDPTALWKHRRNSRVFMAKSAVEVIQTVFQEWVQRSPLFASSLTLDKSGLTKDYDVRPFLMQQSESDFDFLTRLMRAEGINWLIDEAQLKVPNTTEQIQAQKLRLIDDNAQFSALERRNIRFHRSSAVEASDSIIHFTGQRSLQPTSVHIQRWQADVLDTDEGAGSVQSKHNHSENYDNASLGLEQAWHFSPAWIQDLNGEDGATPSGNSQVERFNQNLSNYYNVQAKQFTAISTVRDAQVGYHFELNEHPSINLKDTADRQFLIISKTFYNQNNLPKDLTNQVETLLKQSDWQITNITTNNSEERQANTLTLIRRNIAIVPEYNPLQHRPIASPQRAIVVGPSGEEIHVDEWGRIKVRFLFTRNEDNTHDGGAGSNDNDTDSAWVDVLTPWAGEGYGARFLPRIGEVVVIDFFAGDIDRPFIVGRIHEGYRHPTQFDGKGKLPDTKKLSGIKSKEYQGSGYNQLRFDDTKGQLSSQLQSSHGASQLNLGKLSHPKDQAESDDRGEGFELRTDQWGALRAGQGLLISTYAQDQAKGDHLESEIAQKQLESSQTNSKALSDIAKNQKTDEIESIEQLKAFAEAIEKDIAKYKKAIMLLSSADGIALSTPEDIHLSATGIINHSAGDSINFSTQKNLLGHALGKVSLFAAQGGINFIAAQGKFNIHAQSNALDVFAKLGITISSTEDRIEISSPKEVLITGGSSQIALNGSGIFPKTGGKFEVNAGQHTFKPGASVSKSAQLPPSNPMKGALDLLKSYGGKDFFKQTGFNVIDSFGKQVSGKLDGNGFAKVTGIAPGPAKVEFETDPRSAWNQGSHFNRDYAWSEEAVGGVTGFAQNALKSMGQNMMSQLKDNLFSLNGDSLKNMGKNALKDLGTQSLGQFKQQFTQSALGSVSSAMNLNLSPSQMMNVGQMIANPSQTLQNIKDQGIDFFKDQASAAFAQKSSGLLSNLTSATGFGSGLGQGFVAESFGSGQNLADTPVKVVDDFVKKDEYFSRFLTYSITTRKGEASSSPTIAQSFPQTVSQPSPILTQNTSPVSPPQEVKKPQSIYNMDKDVVRMDLEESRYVTKQVTVRKTTPEDPDVYSARNK